MNAQSPLTLRAFAESCQFTRGDAIPTDVYLLINRREFLGVFRISGDPRVRDLLEEVEAMRVAAIATAPDDENSWRAQFLIERAMRYMDNAPSLSREQAYALAEADIESFESRPGHLGNLGGGVSHGRS